MALGRVGIVASDYLGDNLLSLPLVRQAARHADSVTVVCAPTFTEVFERWVPVQPEDDTVSFNSVDTLLLLRHSLRWAWRARRQRVPCRVGFDFERLGVSQVPAWNALLSHVVPQTPLCGVRPQTDIYLDLLRALDVPVEDLRVPWPIHRSEQDLARHWLQGLPRPVFALHMTAKSLGKQWPYWVPWIQQLHALFQPTFVAIGTEREQARYARIYAQAGVPYKDWCGRLSIPQTMAVLNQLDAVVTLDTATAHMAALAHCPRLLVIYGPTNQHTWHPPIGSGTRYQAAYQALPCRPCTLRTCWDRQCVKALTPEVLLPLFLSLWNAHEPRAKDLEILTD